VIVTVTPNPALDVTYAVDRVALGRSHRVREVREVAGGKGLNVAGVLTAMGREVMALGLVGAGGEAIAEDLAARGIRHSLGRVDGTVRRTVTVVSSGDGEATAFNEPGPRWTAQAADTLRALVTRTLGAVRPAVLVISGSVPPGMPVDGLSALVAIGRAHGCVVIVDAAREALAGVLGVGPDLVKPNHHELAEVVGTTDPVTGAARLRERGANQVVVSCGPRGLVLVDDGLAVRASLPDALRGNATGAGDAAVAALAAGLAEGRSGVQLLADAVAWSAASVLEPTAGIVDPAVVERLRATVVLTAEPATG